MRQCTPTNSIPSITTTVDFRSTVRPVPVRGFGQFVATMRRLQDLAVAADPGDAVWDERPSAPPRSSSC